MPELGDVGFVKRITLGSTNPENVQSEVDAEGATQLLNRCLSEAPKGWILAVEKNFSLLNIGEHQVVLQTVTYHVGFARKPLWLGV